MSDDGRATREHERSRRSSGNRDFAEGAVAISGLPGRDWWRIRVRSIVTLELLPTGRTPLLQDAQELGLHFERQLAISSEENRAPCSLKETGFRFYGSVKAPFS